ncbi:MAG: 50S ribosomal protein L20 [Synergistetes bacterium]|nr:50S ribosomal protein L20 [Synergistota bacterium]MCX8127382.1 50S ribosomal protein L20 [Synergistota bacterium]MDW8192246.1 50S ribosomal protein L20 [Synergistota bacterium]
MRVKNASSGKGRRKKLFKLTKGYYGQKKNVFKRAHEAMLKALSYSYRDRRAKKGDFRKLWIARINAAAREEGLTYNRFINGLKKAGVAINRKVLAELAIHDRESFSELVRIAKENLGVA